MNTSQLQLQCMISAVSLFKVHNRQFGKFAEPDVASSSIQVAIANFGMQFIDMRTLQVSAIFDMQAFVHKFKYFVPLHFLVEVVADGQTELDKL